MCVRTCNALVLKLDYLSTTVYQKVHFLPSDAILRILTRASCACPRTLRMFAHISRGDTQDGVSVGGFKKGRHVSSPVIYRSYRSVVRKKKRLTRAFVFSAHVLLFSAPTCTSQCKLHCLRANTRLSALLY